jgi:hypothetical protein
VGVLPLPWQVGEARSSEARPSEARSSEARSSEARSSEARAWARAWEHRALEGVNESEVRVAGALPSLQVVPQVVPQGVVVQEVVTQGVAWPRPWPWPWPWLWLWQRPWQEVDLEDLGDLDLEVDLHLEDLVHASPLRPSQSLGCLL